MSERVTEAGFWDKPQPTDRDELVKIIQVMVDGLFCGIKVQLKNWKEYYRFEELLTGKLAFDIASELIAAGWRKQNGD